MTGHILVIIFGIAMCAGGIVLAVALLNAGHPWMAFFIGLASVGQSVTLKRAST